MVVYVTSAETHHIGTTKPGLPLFFPYAYNWYCLGILNERLDLSHMWFLLNIPLVCRTHWEKYIEPLNLFTPQGCEKTLVVIRDPAEWQHPQPLVAISQVEEVWAKGISQAPGLNTGYFEILFPSLLDWSLFIYFCLLPCMAVCFYGNLQKLFLKWYF